MDTQGVEVLLSHLDECEPCRQVVSTMFTLQEEQVVLARSHTWRWWQQPITLIATAAVLMIAIGLTWRFVYSRFEITEPQVYARVVTLLESSHFGDAEDLIDEANEEGIRSPRLDRLMIQAMLETPSVLSLTHFDKLTDYGLTINGIAEREPESENTRREIQALEILNKGNDQSPEAKLNRGQLMLRIGLAQEALEEFKSLNLHDRNSFPAQLGMGIALFLLNDFVASEEAFRRCLELEPSNSSAQINLAMVLTEQGKVREAIQTWETLLDNSDLPDAKREEIHLLLDELRRVNEKQP